VIVPKQKEYVLDKKFGALYVNDIFIISQQ
jgi:hypothetical protein